jgi:hypothetical protein
MHEFYFVKITISNISILINIQSVFMKRWNLNLKKRVEIEIKMINSCKDCQQTIDWNKIARDKLNTRRPLNPDGSIHSCNIGNRPSISKPIPESNDYPNPITKIMTETNTGANWVRSITSDNKQENPTLEALILEFYTLLKHITEYIEQQANK